jgi:predicted acetyltransferase
MAQDLTYSTMADGEMPAVIRLIVHAFAGTAEGVEGWLKGSESHMRVVKAGAGRPPESCLLRIPMGQYFGGRSVSMLGIAGVGVAPEARGTGLAKFMMQESTREAARDGFAIAALYPSTQTLYRSVGYEQGGHRMMARLPIAEIDVREKSLGLVALGEDDWPAVKACYAAFAARFDGMVDRGPYIWARVAKWHDQKFHGFGIRNASGGLDGYVFLLQKRKETSRQEITVQDFAFLTPESGRRLLQFFGDFGTMGDDVTFSCGPSHPALMLLPRQKYKLEFNYYWMIRIVNIAKAFSHRGYAPAVRAKLELDVTDDIVRENAGRWTLQIEGGRCQASRGGSGRIRCDIRGLAAMYSGHLSASALALTGLVSGEESALRETEGVFGGGSPWMTDFF